MLKKLLAAVLTLAMVLSMFTACGSKQNQQNTTTPDNSTNTTESGLWDDYKADTTKNLSNPNATDKAQAIYNWLLSIEGKYIISGQQEQCGDTKNEEYTYIKGLTKTDDSTAGVIPALRGLDFINGDYEGVVTRSIQWAKYNSLISICWHMGVPGEVDAGYDSSKATYAGLTDAVNDPESEGYKQLIADMDLAAEALKKLQDEGIVVLWRPFHEFDGKWFWWGKDGEDTFVKLWQIMYDRYTNYHGLNNLIWVLGYTGNQTIGNPKWYPGDEYVDIIGADSYSNTAADNGYSSMYKTLNERLPDCNKPSALHECGRLPNIGKVQENKANWLWFLVWHSEYIDNEEVNPIASVVGTYGSDYVLTLDEMPDFDELLAK